ncbi:ABC transporter substrate-binding protein [Brevibacillus choshinensis]|uniref:ABC transporter substrate-binding protein n=1 Tax=Brevibacillus choshinensis TaxID=54911 RepID=UPI002E1C9D1B|nr:ABC transporter substrate-binding protein [Brevibacillus choshinensis]
MKKAFGLLVMLLILVVVACTPATNVDEPAKGQVEANTGSKTPEKVVIALESDAVTMLANTDVNYVNDVQLRNIYDPLVSRDIEGKIIPNLATEWSNPDSNTWEFKLKDQVLFHNGKPFNAEAVKYNIDFILDETNQSFYRSRWLNVKEAQVVDDRTIRIITTKPFANFLDRLADDLLIMEPSHVKELGLEKAASNPIGTGPYKFSEWKRDQYLELVANDQYWAGKPAIPIVRFRYIPEFSARLSALMSGEVNLIKNLPVDSVEKVKAQGNVKVAVRESARLNYVALNTFYDGPLKDKKVRQAIRHAINVDELLASVLNGYGTKMKGPLPKVNSGYTETPDYAYDQEKAKQLLKEAGIEPAQLKLQLDTPNGRYPMDSQVAQAIQAQLARIGINVDVQVNEWGNHLSKIRKKEMKDMYINGWGPSLEPQTTVEGLFTKNAPYSGFYDSSVEEQILATIPVFEKEERKKGFDAIQNRLVEEAAFQPLWQQADIYAMDKKLKFEPRVDERLQVHDMSW